MFSVAQHTAYQVRRDSPQLQSMHQDRAIL